MLRSQSLIAWILIAAGTTHAQTIVVRDTIVPLPPISFCMDGATHATEVTGHRLRARNVDLETLVGKPLEIRGTIQRITCEWIEVSAVKVLDASHRSVATNQSGVARVEFYGDAPVGAVYMVYISAGLLKSPILLPTIDGPIHVDPAAMVLGGIGVPLGGATPYASLSAPVTPALLNVDFFDQAVVTLGSSASMSNVNVFRF